MGPDQHLQAPGLPHLVIPQYTSIFAHSVFELRQPGEQKARAETSNYKLLTEQQFAINRYKVFQCLMTHKPEGDPQSQLFDIIFNIH